MLEPTVHGIAEPSERDGSQTSSQFVIADIRAHARQIAQGNTVVVFDTTLRDGEQSPGATLNTQKLGIKYPIACPMHPWLPNREGPIAWWKTNRHSLPSCVIAKCEYTYLLAGALAGAASSAAIFTLEL